MRIAQRNVVCRIASIIPGTQELIKNVIGNNGLLYKINKGRSIEIHFCSIDQSCNGYFRKECPNQHITPNAVNKKINRNQISNSVNAGL